MRTFPLKDRGGSKMVGGEAARRYVEGMRRLDTPPSPPAVEQRTTGRRRLQLWDGLLTGLGAPILRREKILKKRSNTTILPSETKGVTVLDQGGQDMSLEGTCFFPGQGSMGEAVQNSPEKISCEQLPYCGDLWPVRGWTDGGTFLRNLERGHSGVCHIRVGGTSWGEEMAVTFWRLRSPVRALGYPVELEHWSLMRWGGGHLRHLFTECSGLRRVPSLSPEEGGQTCGLSGGLPFDLPAGANFSRDANHIVWYLSRREVGKTYRIDGMASARAALDEVGRVRVSQRPTFGRGTWRRRLTLSMTSTPSPGVREAMEYFRMPPYLATWKLGVA